MKNSDCIAWPKGRAGTTFVCLFASFGLFLLAASPDARAEVNTPTPRDVSLGVMVALAMGAREEEAIAVEPPTPTVSSDGKQKACPIGHRYLQKIDACRKPARTHKKIERQSASR
jgi:hypothetical protein